MDENATDGPTKKLPAKKPAPISPAWTATPAPSAGRSVDGDSTAASSTGGETAAPWPAPGDTTSGIPAPGDTTTGWPAPGDTAAAWPAPGDTAGGTPAPGDTETSGPTSGNSGTAVGSNEQLGLRASDLDRRRVASVLHEALGRGQLTITEFDERTAAAWAARYTSELDGLTVDLIPSRFGLDAAQHHRRTPSDQIQPPASARVTGDGGPSASVAVFSGFERKGVWTVPERFTAVAIMGGGVIDIRHANFGAQHVTITATAIMGGIDVIVPDDVQVEVTGFAFMGGFDDTRKWDGRSATPDQDAPRVTINGFALMGGVTVSRKASGPVSHVRHG